MGGRDGRAPALAATPDASGAVGRRGVGPAAGAPRRGRGRRARPAGFRRRRRALRAGALPGSSGSPRLRLMLRYTIHPLRAAALLAVCVSAPAALAQEDERARPPAVEASVDDTPHTLEIRDGALWLDGRALPDSAVPDEIDLAGLQMS